jgi:IrrE N-terminal-like domain
MNVPLWVSELASAFWSWAGELEPFPRNLRGHVENAVPLTRVSIQNLSVSLVLKWLRENDLPYQLQQRDRPLFACLHARKDFGIVFLDSCVNEDEQRFSLAHELAHFLRDYSWPRARVAGCLGQAALEVLDGGRAATSEERVHALLDGTPLGYHTHFMDRENSGRVVSRRVRDAEDDADRLAFELLAPARSVASCAHRSEASCQAEIQQLLISKFGLPEVPAGRYAEILAPPARVDPLLQQLRSLLARHDAVSNTEA